jgi:predicted metal-dependent peptidase
LNEQVFIVLHELLHVALAHPARAKALSLRQADFDAHLFNVATDAIINATLSGVFSNLPAPKKCISLKAELERIGKWEHGDTESAVVAKWSAESLYFALREHERLNPNSGIAHPVHCTLHPSPASSPDQLDDDIRDWQGKLTTVIGVVPGLKERLAGDLPRPTRPWQQDLRDWFRHVATPGAKADFARPHRRYSALEGEYRATHGVDLPFMPGKRPRKTGRIGVVADSSGSVDDDVLGRFTAEIASMMALTRAEIVLIVADAEVQTVDTLKGWSGQQRLRGFTYKGGGGTDFVPAIEKAREFAIDGLVYFTDLYGPCGNEPPFPVLWACTTEKVAPWGRTIALH